MSIGSVHAMAANGGMGQAAARVAAIQSRIASLQAAPPVGQPAAGVGGGRTASAAFTTAGVPGGVPGTSAFVLPGASAAPGAGGAPDQSTLAARLPENGRAWAPAITAAAERAGIDPALLAAVVRHESNFDPGVVSRAGAIGLAQLMPGTAAGLGVDPTDPQQNLAGGARYLRTQLDRFGSVELALAAYNAGPTRVAQAGGVPRIPETMAYVDKVLATWEQWR